MALQDAPPAQAQQQQVAATQNAVVALFSRLKDVGAGILCEVRFNECSLLASERPMVERKKLLQPPHTSKRI